MPTFVAGESINNFNGVDTSFQVQHDKSRNTTLNVSINNYTLHFKSRTEMDQQGKPAGHLPPLLAQLQK